MYQLLIYDLVDDYLERRSEFREEHLRLARQAYARGELLLAGPLADPVDSALLVFNGEGPEPAQRFAEADPYVRAGLVKQWRVRPWTVVVGGAPAGVDHSRVVELSPREAIALSEAAHRRLSVTLESIDDDVAGRPSRLPGWSVAHVLTHLARNADGHTGRLEGALQGREVARYPGGQEQRDADIEAGAGRPAAELVADVRASAARLEETWARCERAGWPHPELLGGDAFPTTGSPLRRLREVEVHHVDLGLGYEPSDWPADYVDWELGFSLPRLPHRLPGEEDRRHFLAWLIGRGGWPDDLQLRPWL